MKFGTGFWTNLLWFATRVSADHYPDLFPPSHPEGTPVFFLLVFLFGSIRNFGSGIFKNGVSDPLTFLFSVFALIPFSVPNQALCIQGLKGREV